MTEDRIADKRPWKREMIAEAMFKVEAKGSVMSQRQLAEEMEIPRSTLQHWLDRRNSLETDPAVAAFFESPAGSAFLHRLVIGAHFVMTLLGPCGIRLVCMFLELTGLNLFVASSYSAQQKVAVAIEQATVDFGDAEKLRLAQGMTPKKISVCEDETFHPETCLVAIEPVSNFILLEKYADNRKAETWTQLMTEATQGLPVTLIQSTSDEGRGILRHVEKDLGIHHSPDIFHVQQDVVRGICTAVASQKRQAEKAVADATQQVEHLKNRAMQDDVSGAQTPLEAAQALEQTLTNKLHVITQQQERAHEAINGISAAYHPYDLETGAARSTEQVADLLAQKFSELETIAEEVSLPERGIKKIQKAKRVIVGLLATLTFFWTTVRAKVEALSLPQDVEQAVYSRLIPAIYLSLVASKSSDPTQRRSLRKKSDELLAPFNAHDGPLASLKPSDIRTIEAVALECAQLFQRSSSCVEGRNGLLALRHHSLHRLTNRKLAAITTVHNYFTPRSDGTTAAERFFGAKPKDMFAWLLERVDLPGWPAKKRSQPKPKAYLLQAAA